MTMGVGHASATLKAVAASSRSIEGSNLMLLKWSILQELALIGLMIVLSFSVPASQINLYII